MHEDLSIFIPHVFDNFFMQPTDAYEIKRVVQNKLVQQTTEEITIHIEHIINQSFVTSDVADNLKIAKIIAVFKARNSYIFNNYRPIRILPTLF